MLVAPALLTVAWTGWMRRDRVSLPSWRNGLGLTALLLPSLGWAASAAFYLSWWLGHNSRGFDGFVCLMLLWYPVLIVALVLAVALKDRSRTLTLVAGLLMLIGGPAVYWACAFRR